MRRLSSCRRKTATEGVARCPRRLSGTRPASGRCGGESLERAAELSGIERAGGNLHKPAPRKVGTHPTGPPSLLQRLSPPAELRTSVKGVLASSGRMTIRNRWPSALTS